MTTDPKSILVLGTNAGQADLIRYMKSLGWTVYACAHRAGGAGESFADAFYLVDILNVEAVTQLASKLGVDLVYSISSDIAITTAVSVSEILQKPHFFNTDLVYLFNQKPKMREFLNAHDLGHVPFRRIEKIEEISGWHIFPCMVKPSDSQGQRGVRRVNFPSELSECVDAALSASSQSGTAIIEAYLGGVEVSCNVLVKDSELVFDVLSERLAYDGALTGVPRGHLVPCINVNDDDVNAALDLVHRSVKALNITDGCLYFQMKITSEGPRIIEIAPRLDGCHMWRLIKHATDEDFLKATVHALLGLAPTVAKRPVVETGAFFELMFQQEKPGSLFKGNKHPIPKDALYHEYRYSEGETVLPINGKMENVGYYVRKMRPGDVEAHRVG